MPLRDALPRFTVLTRQGVLFVIAIVIPCVLLVGLSLRMLRQERELTDKRAADDRRQFAGQIRQHLLTYLERVKLDALSERATPSAAELGPRSTTGALALIATIERDQVVLPWDRHPDVAETTVVDARFEEAVLAGEHEEHVALQFDRAIDAYRRAMTLASTPEQHATAQLALAVTLAKAGRAEDASAAFGQLLHEPLTVVDDEGFPFALYAARRLLSGPVPTSQNDVLTAIRGVAEEPSASPAVLHMASELADRLASQDGQAPRGLDTDLRRLLDARKLDVEQAQALQHAFPALASATAFTPADPIWLPFGTDDRLWLVTVTPNLEGTDRLLIAARSSSALTTFDETIRGEPRVSIVRLNTRAEGELLGRSFPGLAVALLSSDGPARERQGFLQRTFYFGALFLVLSVALSGGYLFWRDVQRDLRLSSMRSQFVSSVSHELKTPLTAIRMFAETLRMGRAVSPADRDEYLDTIVNETERLTRLLNNVLDFSKIEQGRKVYRLEPHPLGAVVRSAARTMQYPLSQQGFALRVDVDDSLPEAPSDPDALEQAVLNLLSNAMKYSGSGRVIDLTLTREGCDAVVSVTDRGLGIPAAEHTKIFEKFYRVANTGQQLIAGTGLGLTLVEHTAVAHGGRVTVRSAPGEGSTFSIVLPLTLAPRDLPSESRGLQSQES